MTGILIAGTSSDAGKSLVVTGICRALRRRGVDVVPFKAQNMSNNSMVCADGSEIGRAQYLQAQAAQVLPTSAMNPVLLKPGSDRRAHVVLRGQPWGTLEAGEYATERRALADAAYAAFAELSAAHEFVVCEGAGSPAEINLRRGDYVNLGLARQFDLPVVVVGDIDRGGVLAALYGTWALLDEPDRACLKSFVINKFRGDPSILEPGLVEISRRTGLTCLGVLPWLLDVWLDSEDTLAVGRRESHLDHTTPLSVAVVRLPRISNATDVDALTAEPGVEVTVTIDPHVCAAADLLVLPGTRATTDDLAWLREHGLADVVARRARDGRPVLGICGGYQMLGRTITDESRVEGGGHTSGLGLLPVDVIFGPEKHLGRPADTWRGNRVEGYEIHHGTADGLTGADAPAGEPFPGGLRQGPVWGTMWHGTLENDDFRRAWLTEIASSVGSNWRPDPDAPGFAARREHMIDTLADAVEQHLDLDALLGLAGLTPPSGTSLG